METIVFEAISIASESISLYTISLVESSPKRQIVTTSRNKVLAHFGRTWKTMGKMLFNLYSHLLIALFG